MNDLEMKIVHYLPRTTDMISQYVNMLGSTMSDSNVTQLKCNNLSSLRKIIKEQHPNIIHFHGCWHISFFWAFRMALKHKIRVVISPHGQLEPWIVKQNYWKVKLPHILFYQRRIVKKAYCIISMGKMEKNCINKLKWADRIEMVKNALITESITPEMMIKEITQIYRKVLDSNVVDLMDEHTFDMLISLIKTGITGNTRWLNNEEYNVTKEFTNDAQWRQIIVYAHQENISEVVAHGALLLGIDIPNIDVENIEAYLPHKYKREQLPLIKQIKKSATNDTDLLVYMIQASKKKMRNNMLNIHDIIELACALRQYSIDEFKASSTIEDMKLKSYTESLMQVIDHFTGLEEGFMILPAVDNKLTRKIEMVVTNNQKI